MLGARWKELTSFERAEEAAGTWIVLWDGSRTKAIGEMGRWIPWLSISRAGNFHLHSREHSAATKSSIWRLVLIIGEDQKLLSVS